MMEAKTLFSSRWMRVVVFLWMFVFPIIFVGIPALEMFGGETSVSMKPVWAFLVWVLGPLVVAIVLKNWGGRKAPNE